MAFLSQLELFLGFSFLAVVVEDSMSFNLGTWIT